MKHHDKTQQKQLQTAASSLSEALLSLNTRSEVKQFLEDLCTPAEVEAMVSILKGRLGFGANLEIGDTDTLKVFGRFSFGK